MTETTEKLWELKRTDESRMVEDFLRRAGFEQVDAYRYNLASLRVRVIDAKFEGLSDEDRDGLVEPFIHQLPEDTQSDIVSLYTFAPSDLTLSKKTLREILFNDEFENPSPSIL